MTRRLALLSLLLAGCPAPGEGAKAERGYAACAPVIDALARHLDRTGSYPDSLAELVNAFDGLAEIPRPNGNELGYKRRDNNYSLVFTYTGPGMNRCEISAGVRWHCSGYY